MDNPCEKIRDKTADYVLGILSQDEIEALDKHISQCSRCREYAEVLQNEKSSLLQFGEKLDKKMTVREAKVVEALNQLSSEKVKLPSIWRIIMKSRIPKFAAAAVIIIAVLLSITFLDKSVAPVYALEQTIQASHSVRYLHIRSFVSPDQEPGKTWVEFDEAGQVKNVRIDLPEWAGGGDGPKLVIWKENKAQLWMKKKKSLMTIKDKTVAAQMVKMVELLDPKLAVERLQKKEEQGKAKLEIEKPANKAEPIIITATSVEENDSPFQRVVLFVDQATKLVISTELYKLKGSKYNKVMTLEYYDYNQPIDAKMFTMDDVPDDVTRIDQTTQEIGLAQGDLTGKEIAVKVVREFYEALIARDYAKAGRLFEGIPAEKIREIFGDINVVRIISIDEPKPHPMPGVGGFMVPCKLEIEKDGIKSVYEPYGPGVRPVHGQPNRWDIHGGVK